MSERTYTEQEVAEKQRKAFEKGGWYAWNNPHLTVDTRALQQRSGEEYPSPPQGDPWLEFRYRNDSTPRRCRYDGNGRMQVQYHATVQQWADEAPDPLQHCAMIVDEARRNRDARKR